MRFFLGVGLVVMAMSGSEQLGAQAPYTSRTPVTAARLFVPDHINSAADEYGPTFTPAGDRLYFVRRANRRGNETIVMTSYRNGAWGAVEPVSFSGTFYDKEPFLSPDGRRMFFASTRPGGGSDEAFDLWMVDRTREGWGEPVRLSDAVNSASYDNYPSVAANGNLYFGSRRPGGLGALDLYVSRFANGEYQAAESLGEIVNSASTDADPYIAPDESYIIFSSTRPGGSGSGDLYVSLRTSSGWGAPQSLGTAVNGDDFDYTPLVTPDGKYLFFSRGWGDIYFIEVDALPVRLPRR